MVAEGNCFSSNDTSGLEFEGNYAGLLRANRRASIGSTGILTSAPFTAGIGVTFRALTETIDGRDIPEMPVNFIVRILSADGAPLLAVGLDTAVVKLSPGCPGLPANGAFSTHFVDTRQFAGRQVRIEFLQSSRVRQAGFFTLVDEVIRIDEGDSQVLPDRPRAVAGVSRNGAGRLRLDGSNSSDAGGIPLTFEWTVAGEAFRREGEFPCIDDLDPGAHQATLLVSNGLYSDADSIHFAIREVTAADDVVDGDDGATDETDDADDVGVLDGGLTLDCSDSGDGDGTEVVDGGEGGAGEDAQARATAGDLSGTGIVWKPISEADGNLVVLMPTAMGEPGAAVYDAGGQLVETGRYVGHTNGNRATYRFSRPGRSFPAPALLAVGDDSYRVERPAQRYN